MQSHPEAASNSTLADASLPPPTILLTLSKCQIRTLHPSDAPSLAYHCNNPLIAKWMRNAFPSPYTLSSAEAWISTCLASDPIYNFAISPLPTSNKNKDDDDDDVNPSSFSPVIGSIGLRPTPPSEIDALSWEVGYWLGQDAWGQGIMLEALRAFVDWAFRTIAVRTADGGGGGGGSWGLQRLHADVLQGNEASARLLRRCGFVCEGRLRCAVVKEGVVLDSLVFAVTRKDWEEASSLRGGRGSAAAAGTAAAPLPAADVGAR